MCFSSLCGKYLGEFRRSKVIKYAFSGAHGNVREGWTIGVDRIVGFSSVERRDVRSFSGSGSDNG